MEINKINRDVYITAATEWKEEADKLREALGGLGIIFSELAFLLGKNVNDFTSYTNAKEAINNYDNKLKN